MNLYYDILLTNRKLANLELSKNVIYLSYDYTKSRHNWCCNTVRKRS